MKLGTKLFDASQNIADVKIENMEAYKRADALSKSLKISITFLRSTQHQKRRYKIREGLLNVKKKIKFWQQKNQKIAFELLLTNVCKFI